MRIVSILFITRYIWKEMKSTDDKLLELMVNLSNRSSADLKTISSKVLILSTPRCGSTMFCDVLNNTKKLGECAEWFNSRYIAAYGKMMGNLNVNFNDYLNFILEKTIADTGVFVVNAHIEQVVYFAQKKVNLLNLKFDHIIYLYRKDKISQAVSLAKSRLTDSWTSDVAAAPEALDKMNNAVIVGSLKHIVDSDKNYQDSLAKYTNAEFAYEDFCKLEDTPIYSELFEKLNIEYLDVFNTSMQKQRNLSSKDFLSDFKKYLLGE